MLLLGRHITFHCSVGPLLAVSPLDLLHLIQFAYSLMFLKTPFYLTYVSLFCFSNCALARYSVFVLTTQLTCRPMFLDVWCWRYSLDCRLFSAAQWD